MRLAAVVLRTQPDDRLLALAREGSKPAFEELVRRYRTSLLAFAGRIVGPSRADDAVQDSSLKAYLALKRGDDVEHPRAWLYGIVRNTSLNHLRGERQHDELDETIDGVEQPPQAFERRRQFTELITSLGELPEQQRAALVQRELEGKGHDEIAGSLGVSAGAVRQLIYRARHTLRAGVSALIPAQLVRMIALSGGGADGVVAGTGAGLGLTAAKVGLGTVLATSAVVAGVNVSETHHSPSAGNTAALAAPPLTDRSADSTALRDAGGGSSKGKRDSAPRGRKNGNAVKHPAADHAVHPGGRPPQPGPQQAHAASGGDHHGDHQQGYQAPPRDGGGGGGSGGGGYDSSHNGTSSGTIGSTSGIQLPGQLGGQQPSTQDPTQPLSPAP